MHFCLSVCNARALWVKRALLQNPFTHVTFKPLTPLWKKRCENSCNIFRQGLLYKKGMKKEIFDQFWPISCVIAETVQDTAIVMEGRRIGTCMRHIERCHFQSPWTTTNLQSRHAIIRYWVSRKRYKIETWL